MKPTDHLTNKFIITTVLVALFIVCLPSTAEAASSRLIWSNFEESEEGLIIEDGGTYEVPFGVTKYIETQYDLSSFDTEGFLYFINPDTSSRELVVHVGGIEGVEEFAWELAGSYELDVYDDPSSFPAKVPYWRSFLAWFTPPIVYAQEEEFFLETISFTIVAENEPTIDPVIIIPGIMGSAYKNDQLVIDPILHTYDDLIATLIANGYQQGVDLFTFPYEWRDSNVFTANFLDNKIEQVKLICDCHKVDLVAHSMGGLVSRVYIQSVDYDGDVDQLIFLGTPHKGAPTAYLQWEAGKFSPDFGSVFRETFFTAQALRNGYLRIFDYIRNRPILSIQELLPIFDYIKEDGMASLRTYPNNYPTNIFLDNLDSNISTLFSSGVEISNIIGNSGENVTIDKIRVVPSSQSGLWEHGEPEGFGTLIGDNGLERGVGDNTVPAQSSIMQVVVNEFVMASHNRIPTVAANRVYKILTGNDSTTNIDNGLNLDTKVLVMQLLSPVDFVVTDPDYNKIGKNFQTGSEYNEIPLAFYSGYQTEEEYITILNPLDGEYRIEVRGTGAGGEYGILTSYVTEEFATTTEVSGIIAPNQITNLTVIVDNDNPENLESEREITLDVIISDINGAYKLGWITDRKVRDSLIAQARLIIKFEKKRGGKYEKKVDKLIIRLLERELDLLLKKGKINQQSYTLFKADLKYLVNHN